MKLILHHSGIDLKGAHFGAINESHKRRFGWQSSLGYYGSYSWLIERDGTIRQYRREDEGGAHTLWHNNDIAICMAGNFYKESPSPRQLKSLKNLSLAIIERWNIPEHDVIEHRDVVPTLCPVWDFKGYVKGFISSESEFPPPKVSKRHIKIKTLQRRIIRATGITKHTMQRKLARLRRK